MEDTQEDNTIMILWMLWLSPKARLVKRDIPGIHTAVKSMAHLNVYCVDVKPS